MSSAICLIYLVTEYSWALILVSAFSQPCREQPAAAAAAASTVIKQARSFDRQLLHSFPEILSCVTPNVCFFNKVADFAWSRQSLPVPICKGEPSCCLSLWGARDESVKAPCEEEVGEESGYNPVCSALMPIYSPWHLWGHALTSAGISTPSLPSLMRFLSAQRKPHQIPCALQELSGGPLAAQPRLDCRDCCLAAPASCGVGSDSLGVAAEIAAVVSLNICFLC